MRRHAGRLAHLHLKDVEARRPARGGHRVAEAVNYLLSAAAVTGHVLLDGGWTAR